MSVRTTISLPKELNDFAEQRAAELAKKEHGDPNFSRYIRNLIARDKREHARSGRNGKKK